MTFWVIIIIKPKMVLAAIYLFLTENLIKPIFTFSFKQPHFRCLNIYGLSTSSVDPNVFFVVVRASFKHRSAWGGKENPQTSNVQKVYPPPISPPNSWKKLSSVNIYEKCTQMVVGLLLCFRNILHPLLSSAHTENIFLFAIGKKNLEPRIVVLNNFVFHQIQKMYWFQGRQCQTTKLSSITILDYDL